MARGWFAEKLRGVAPPYGDRVAEHISDHLELRRPSAWVARPIPSRRELRASSPRPGRACLRWHRGARRGRPSARARQATAEYSCASNYIVAHATTTE